MRESQRRCLESLKTAISARWRCDGFAWELVVRHQNGEGNRDGAALRLTGAVVGTAAIAFRADAIGGGGGAGGRMRVGDEVGELFQGYSE